MTERLIRSREQYETLEDEILAPYAMKSRYSKGREYREDEHHLRSPYHRDLARIIHSKAFRRLEYKTQVFVNHEGDHYRTRLTHSLEVAQIARTIARILKLNEDLAETISLAHDLGHTPFGHAGEHCMSALMKDQGGFEHNRQSLRVVTFLEKVYPDFPGLNLTFEVRDGISKHFTDYDNRGLKTNGHYSLEAEVVNLADEIAYNNHDLDDGLRSGMINLNQLKEVPLWQEQYLEVKQKMPRESVKVLQSQTVRSIINRVVTDLVDATENRIKEFQIKTHDDVKGRSQEIVGFSKEIKKKNTELKRFLFKNLYQHHRVVRMANKAQMIIEDIFCEYIKDPEILSESVQGSVKSEGLHRAVCDYIAGMTDRYAQEEYEKLFNPRKKV